MQVSKMEVLALVATVMVVMVQRTKLNVMSNVRDGVIRTVVEKLKTLFMSLRYVSI